MFFPKHNISHTNKNHLGPSFNFMKSRKNNDKKIKKIFPFFDIQVKLGPISKTLRQCSLQINVLNIP